MIALDEAGIAGGASGASGGLVRAFVPGGQHASWAAQSLELFLGRGWHGTWPGLREDGSLTLVGPEEVTPAHSGVTAVRGAGHKAELLSAQEITTRFPALTVPDGFAGVYEPHAGWLPSREVAHAMVRDAGERLRLRKTRVTAVLASSSVVYGVQTTDGPVFAPVVLLAAGVGSAALAATVGVRLPLVTRSVGYCLFDPGSRAAAGPGPGFVATLPTVVDSTTGAWLRRWGETGTVLAGVRSRRTGVPAEVRTDVPAWEVHRVREVVARRCLPLARAPLAGGVLAYDSVAADGTAAVTAWPSPHGLVTAAGWNGGGFKVAPAVGDHVAELIREVIA